MSFVINGSEWKFDGWDYDKIYKAIETVLERIKIASDRGEKVWIGDDFQYRHMYDELDLWSLCSPDHPIKLPYEMTQELTAWLGSAARYADEEWPEGLIAANEIGINSGVLEENLDLAWAHHNVRMSRAVGCIGIGRKGTHTTVSNLGIAEIHWIHDEHSNLNFWRSAIDVERDSVTTLQKIAPHAFPDLFFAKDVWLGLDDLSDGYIPLRREIRKYLSILNDIGAWVFTSPPPLLSPLDTMAAEEEGAITNQIIQERFSYQGLNFSPEKKNVRTHEASRQAREIILGERTLYCEWHGKFERHRNRMYVHAPVEESDGKVIVAIFHRHL